MVALAISLAVLPFAASLGDAGRVLQALEAVTPSLVALLLGCSILNYAVRSLRFYVFARVLGIRLPFTRLAFYYIAGFSMIATPGKVGELIRVWFIRRAHGHRIERGLAMVVADRGSDVIASVLLCLAGAGALTGYGAFALAFTAVVMGMMLFIMRPQLLLLALTLAYRLVGRGPRLFARLRTFVRQTSILFAPRVFLPTLVLALVGWGAECLALYQCVAELSGVRNLQLAVFVFPTANLIGGASLIPAGIGAVEATMVGFLVSGGIAFEPAAAVTVVIRLCTQWFGLALGFVVLFALLRHMKLSKD